MLQYWTGSAHIRFVLHDALLAQVTQKEYVLVELGIRKYWFYECYFVNTGVLIARLI